MSASQPLPELRFSFQNLSEEEIECHCAIRRYGNFELTGAVAPSYDLKVIPVEGFRHDTFRNKERDTPLPVLTIAATRSKLLPLFYDLQECIGSDRINVVAQCSTRRRPCGRSSFTDHVRLDIEPLVFRSILAAYDDLLLEDGHMGIAVFNPRTGRKVQFDEHKLLYVYGTPQEDFERVLGQHHILCDENIAVISAADHVHLWSDAFNERALQLIRDLGADERMDSEPCCR